MPAKRKARPGGPPIVTRTGDAGETGLLGGARVPKDHPRIELLGTLDELTAHLVLARSQAAGRFVQDRLGRLVELVAAATAELACPTADARSTLPRTVGEADVRQLEQIVDEVRGRIAIPPSFLYSAHGVAALLNVARTVARRAERRFVTLQRGEPAENRHLQPLLNRLCDAIFALTRFAEAGEEADNP